METRLMKLLPIRPRYDLNDMEKYEEITKIDFTGDPGLTIQEPAEDADINVLMRRMGVTDGSQLPHFDNPKALYGDFSEMPTDPVEIADIMHQGQLAFMKIPANIRQRYNTPEDLFNWMNDDKNYEEAVQLGLLEKKVTPPKNEPIEVRVVSPSTSSDKEPLVQSSGSTSNKE